MVISPPKDFVIVISGLWSRRAGLEQQWVDRRGKGGLGVWDLSSSKGLPQH